VARSVAEVLLTDPFCCGFVDVRWHVLEDAGKG